MRYRLKIGQHGEISTRKTAGKWEARARVRIENGKYIRKYASARTKTAAIELLKERLASATEATTTNLQPTSTVAELGELWRSHMLTKGLAPRTVDRYEWTLEKHIFTYLGDREINTVSTSTANRFLNMLATDHGNGVAKGARTVLTQMFAIAVQDDILQRNPIRDTEKVKSEKISVEYFTIEQAKQLRTYLTGDVKDVFDVMLGTGVRISEVLAIRWEDIDFSQNRVQITGAVKRTRREGLHRGEPKSVGSRQWLHLPEFSMRALRDRERFCELVFPTSTGGLWESTNYRKRWRRALANTPFADSHPHMVRATVATLISESSGMEAAARQLGHSPGSNAIRHYAGRSGVAPDLVNILEKLE